MHTRAAAFVALRRPRYPVVWPRLSDPRLHVAAVIITVQVLGQTVLHFRVSITQILVAVITAATLELVITARRHGVVAWPASALLTGNGVALILRVPGTAHGDWWAVRGAWIFAVTAAVSLLSKYVVRWRGRHVFNPSNIGLVLCFLVLGSRRAEPLDFWWGKPGPSVGAAVVVIVTGGVFITRRLGMLRVVAASWLSLAAGLGILAAAGHCMTARWHVGPVCGPAFWSAVVASPEIAVFVFFMITDPRTASVGATARTVYGVAVGVLAAVLAAPQRTEFGTKVAVLGALAVVCALVPAVEAHARRVAELLRRRLVAAPAAVGTAAAIVIAGLPARPLKLANAPAAAAAPVAAAPAVVRDRSLDTIDSEVDVGAVARDFAADMKSLHAAVDGQDRRLVASAAAGPMAQRVRDDIAAARRPRLPAASEALTALVVRSRSQPGPQLGVRAGRDSYALVKSRGRYLVYDVAEPWP